MGEKAENLGMTLQNYLRSIPPGNRKYIILAMVTFCLCSLYIVTRERHSYEDVSLGHLYEDKYGELKGVLRQRESALNETYQVLKKTYEANRKQEDTIQSMEVQLKGCMSDLDEIKKREGKIDAIDARNKRIEGDILKHDGDQDRADASIAMCRQEAAAALQDKEQTIWQYQQALERAKEDVEELQKAVRQREGLLREKELQLQETIAAGTRKQSELEHKFEEADRNLAWLVEKKRQDNERHKVAVDEAKTERSCHGDIEILRDELNKALQANSEKALEEENAVIEKEKKKEIKAMEKAQKHG